MIRGVNRQVIVLRPDRDSAFETVYFMLKSEQQKPSAAEKDILREANKIISENYPEKRGRGEKKRRCFLRGGITFMLGVLLGVALSGAIWIMTV
ncbi:MAG: hypothetical protein E7679_02350 [Ruminococcaceae bacterium]|nr:hypothetical protein [Oscillospiraceae bacterium]